MTDRQTDRHQDRQMGIFDGKTALAERRTGKNKDARFSLGIAITVQQRATAFYV